MRGLELNFVTTACALTGQRILRGVGVVRGVVMCSRCIVGAISAAVQTLRGGSMELDNALFQEGAD